MALVIVVKPAYQFGADEPVTREGLNLLGKPTIDLQGTVDQVVIADGAVTTPKLQDVAVTHAKLALDAVKDANVAADAAIALAKLAGGQAHQFPACLPSGVLQLATGVGDVTGQTCKSLPFKGMVTGGLAAGMKLKGATSNATGEVVAVLMGGGGSDGLVILKNASGTWVDGENVVCTNEVGYKDVRPGKSINVGDIVTEQTNGGTGVVVALTENRMTLRQESGLWVHEYGISVNGDGSTAAVVDGPYSVRCQVDFSGGKTYDDAAYFALTRDRRVLPGDLLARSVASAHLKPEGTSGQILVSRGLYQTPAWQTVIFRPSALVTVDDPYYNRKPYTWKVASCNGGGDYLTLATSVNMAEVNNGDAVCFSGADDHLPPGVIRGVVYYIGDKDATARTVRLYTDVSLANEKLVDLTATVNDLTNVFLHRQIGSTQGNCRLFKDTDDSGNYTGPNDGYYQLIYTTPLTTAKVVLAGSCAGYGDGTGGSYNYSLIPVERFSTVTQLRFVTMYSSATQYAAIRLRLAVFENP